MALTRAQIQTAFQNSLGRPATANDENSFFAVSQSGALTDAQVFTTISNSQEANLTADPVVRFYQAAFGRVPDQAGLDNATDYVRAFGATPQTYMTLANQFVQSTEFTNRFGTGTAVDAAYVQSLYSTILGRTASAGEVDAFTSGANGYTTRGGVLYAISQSGEAQGISDTAVNTFLNNAAQGTAVYTGTLYTAQNGSPNNPGTGGQNLVLTTAADALTGTAGNDTFNGVVNATAGSGQTFTVADTINGGAGTDTLNVIFDTASAAAFPAAQVSNVEIFNLRNVSGQTLAVDAATLPGATQVWADRATSDVTVTNLAVGATGGVRGNNIQTSVDSTFGYNTAATAATVAFDGGTKAGVGFVDTTADATGAAAEDAAIASVTISSAPTAVTINSTGAANSINTVALGGAATSLTINATTDFTVVGAEAIELTTAGDAGVTLANWITGFATGATITANGAGKIDLGTLESNVKEVNASGNAGGTTISGGFEAADKFTGGAGNDTLTAGTALTTGSADGGAGTGDRLILTDDAVVATAALAGKFTNFEILRAAEAGADTYDLSTLTGITSVEIDGTSNVAFTGAGSQAFSVIGDNVGNISITNPAFGPGGTDALSLAFNNAVLKVANGVDSGVLTATNVDTLNLSSVGGNLSSATESNSISSLAGSTDLNVVNLTGDTNFSLTTGASSADTISAGTFTGVLTVNAASNASGLSITSGSGNDSITGSGLVDAINAGAGNNTITGGAGIDTINLSSGGNDNVVLTGVVAEANRDVVTGFTAGASTVTGVDKIVLGATDTTFNTAAGAPIVIQDVAAAPTSALTFNTDAADLIELSFNLRGDNVVGQDLDGAADGTNLLAALGQTLSVTADTNKVYIAAYQGNNAYLYYVQEAATDGNAAVAAADIHLVGTFNNVAVGGLTVDNFTLA